MTISHHPVILLATGFLVLPQVSYQSLINVSLLLPHVAPWGSIASNHYKDIHY